MAQRTHETFPPERLAGGRQVKIASQMDKATVQRDEFRSRSENNPLALTDVALTIRNGGCESVRELMLALSVCHHRALPGAADRFIDAVSYLPSPWWNYHKHLLCLQVGLFRVGPSAK